MTNHNVEIKQEEIIEEKREPEKAIEIKQELKTTKEDAPEPKYNKVKKEIISWIKTILLALALAGLISHFLFQIVHVQGRSMVETLQDGDYVFMTRPGVMLGNINRGDVVICRFPNRNQKTIVQLGAPLEIELSFNTLFVKRVVGLPGDTVAEKDGKLYINNNLVHEDYVTYPSNWEYPARALGDNEYMVMGDNRAGSHDSRSNDVGPITADMIVGHAACIIFPFNHIRLIK